MTRAERQENVGTIFSSVGVDYQVTQGLPPVGDQAGFLVQLALRAGQRQLVRPIQIACGQIVAGPARAVLVLADERHCAVGQQGKDHRVVTSSAA